MSSTEYVCAFRGRRDDYQVPWALQESQRLDQFITDSYSGPLLRKLSRTLPIRARKKVEFRYRSEIPSEKVRCLWTTAAMAHVHRWLGISRVASFARLDQDFSRAAERRARQTGSNLLLYTPYAWEAFTASYRHTPCKALFQYHPHQDYENRLLAADMRKHPEVRSSYHLATGCQLPEALQRRITDCWKPADVIFCASTFTKLTLLEAGAPEARCRVVPYGITLSEAKPESTAATKTFRVLYVGMGIQRKGLHHLLAAWARAKLSPESELTLVCRTMDPGFEEIVARSPRTRLIRATSREELNRLYAQSTLFVLPSLTEGFGQVFLEVLSLGCPVLGTANTCLPDLGVEADGVFLVDPGEVESLTRRIEQLEGKLTGHPHYRLAARACAERFTWARFRDGIKAGLQR